MHARMAQSIGHPDGVAGWKGEAYRRHTLRTAHRAIRELARQAGLRARARGPLGAGCIAFPRLAGAVAVDAVSYRLPLRGQRRNCAISRSPASRAPDEGRTLGRRRGNCQRAGERVQVNAYRIGPQVPAMPAEPPEPPAPPPDPAPALREGDFYLEGGYMVFTAAYHLRRGYCCGNRCRHCPYQDWKR
jgi:hypothetical protein